MSRPTCKGPAVPPPEFPPTITISCHEVPRPPPLVPMRSTFCYVNTSQYVSHADIIDNKRKWETFERIENNDSIVLNRLAQTVPTPVNGGPTGTDRVFYNFINNEERNDYLAGQRAHIATYPTVTDFVVPYSKKPIPYTSTVVAALQSINYDYITLPGGCPNVNKGKPKSREELLNEQKALNLFVLVSTQTALYPKSPYKFSGMDEYLTYKKYKETHC